MLLIAVYNQARRKAIMSTGRSQRVRKVEGVDLTDSSGDIVVVTEDCAGISGKESRAVSFKLGLVKQCQQMSLTILTVISNH